MSYKKMHSESRDFWSEWRNRAMEDLRFSNPANPQQWPMEVVRARGLSRPALVFDQSNQYINQVVNDGRQNKPSIEVVPGDGIASDKAAEVIGGYIRNIEYRSRAQIAYDTALEYSCRVGLGWVLVVPEVVEGRYNTQEMRIKRVVNVLDVSLDPNSIEPDASDADIVFYDTMMGDDQFRRKFPKAKKRPPDGWAPTNGVLVTQIFERVWTQQNTIILRDGRELSEDDYWSESQRMGMSIPVHSTYLDKKPSVKWMWCQGDDVLEETTYPSKYLGMVPCFGNELWVDGKRDVCGMVRRMMDGCRAYNYERSAYIESIALAPKAPWIAPMAAIEQYRDRWEASNRENAAVLPYNHVDDSGNPIPSPNRQNPPAVGSAFVDNAQMALSDIQASVGMYKANLGQNSNAKSGVAINRLQVEGDTGTFHYLDNLNRCIEQVGRIIVDSFPRLADQARTIQIINFDGSTASANIEPDMPSAYEDGETISINPAIGAYEVRIKTGPSYTSMREEMSSKLIELSNGNPQLGAALAPLMLEMADMPQAKKVAKIAMAMLPPEVRAAYDDEQQGPEVDPAAMAQIQQLQQQNQQLMGALEQLQSQASDKQAQTEMEFNKLLIDAYGKETDRLKAVGQTMSPEMVKSIAVKTWQELMMAPSPTQELAEEPQGFEAEAPEMAATGAYPGPDEMSAFDGAPNV